MPPQSEKDALRRKALQARDRLALDWREGASRTINSIGADSLDIQPGDIVSGFFPIRSEVDIRPLLRVLHMQGATVCLPAVIDRKTIEFREFDPDAELVETGFGTYGPAGHAKVLDPHLLLVPLAAFDRYGHRIGYGAGYYDRAIDRLREQGRSPRLFGVAFDVQEVDKVPYEDHDVAMEAILTESGLHTMPRQGN